MTPLRTPRFLQRRVADAAFERADIETGLLRVPARAAPKYFYDRLGSRLFEAITELPEYYPTRTRGGDLRRARRRPSRGTSAPARR